MLPLTKRAALLAVMVVGLIAAHATVAMADIAPASTPITGNSTTTALNYSGTSFSCTTADARGTTPARGTSSLSVALSFGQNGGSCRAFGFTITVICTGRATLRITRFSAPSATGTTALDRDFNCTIRIPLAACSETIQGPQTNIGTWDFTNTNRILNNTYTNIATTDSGGTCNGNTAARTGRGTGSFTGRYTFATRLTFS
jgi:hypothetical protein